MSEGIDGPPVSGAEAESRLLEARAPAEWSGERVDRAASRLFGDYSRAALARALKSGHLHVNGKPARPGFRLAGGETLALRVTSRPQADWQSPQPATFAIVHEDADLLVVDKPAGLVTHPGAGRPSGTLVNGLLHHRQALAELPRSGIVHRLDQHTSGLMIVAASLAAHGRLTAAFREHRIRRRYTGFAEGVMSGGHVIDSPLGRDPRQRIRQSVRADGRPARTRVWVRQRFRAHTRFDAELETGRTHQIRVHLASIGHPLVGDRLYGARGKLPPSPHPDAVPVLRQFPHQALHACELEFEHPISGAPCRFCSPLPGGLAELDAVLHSDLTRAVPQGSNP